VHSHEECVDERRQVGHMRKMEASAELSRAARMIRAGEASAPRKAAGTYDVAAAGARRWQVLVTPK